MNQFERALAFYREASPLILAGVRDEWAIDPYSWERVIRMTPIEAWLWSDIRNANVVMYPQYPVEKFFVDFANPIAKVAIECDGLAFHLDRAKDARRDDRLHELGWRVYRISGRDCGTEADEETGQYGYARRFIEEIADRHHIKRGRARRVVSGVAIAHPLIDHLIEVNKA